MNLINWLRGTENTSITAMNEEEPSNSAPPIIGECVKCQTAIRASHAYAWCTKCHEPLSYRVNMERRPIIYETPKNWVYTFGGSESGIPR